MADVPSDIVWDSVPGKDASPVSPAKSQPNDIVWDQPASKSSGGVHTLKLLAQGFLGAWDAATTGATPQQTQQYLKGFGLDEKPAPFKSDPNHPVTSELSYFAKEKLPEFIGGAMTPVPGGAAKEAGALSAARAADKATGMTAGQVTGSKPLQMLERTLARLPGGGSLVDALQTQTAKAGETTDDIVQRLSGGSDASPSGAGKVIQGQLKVAAQRMKDEASGLYDEVEKLIPPDTLVGVKSTRATLSQLTTPTPGATQTSAALINKDIASLRQGLEKDLESSSLEGMPYSVLKELRTKIGQQIDWGPFATDPKNGQLKLLYHSLTADMNNGAASVSAEAAQAVQKANASYAISKQQQAILKTVLKKAGGPEKVFTSLINGTREGATTLQQVLSAVDEPSRQLLAASALQRMGRATPGAQDASGAAFSADTFLTNWNRMSPEARQALFGSLPGDYAKSINQLAMNVDALKAYKKIIANPSNTAQAALYGGQVGAFLYSVITGNFAAAGGIAGSAAAVKVLSAALTNPQTAAYLAQQTGRLVISASYGAEGVKRGSVASAGDSGGFNQ